MDSVNESEFILAQIRVFRRRSRLVYVIEQPQPLECSDSVEDSPLGTLEAVREAAEEAGGGQEEEEDRRQWPGGGVADAVVGEDRRQELER